MPNHLANENSPYLLQHANNPVDWYPWGEEALEKAQTEDKPIFLSVGYAACHWCHVMENESFEDEDTASLLNQFFISIKVDREERPDIDSIYMQAVVAMTHQGGWPMSVFLSPQGQPFYGGTYFPPVRRYNMPAFTEILLTIARLWQEDRQQLLKSGEQISQFLRQQVQLSTTSQPLDAQISAQAALILAQNYDWKNGGWGSAPKFPQPMVIEFLLQRASLGDKMALDLSCHALRAMARGGMYDVVIAFKSLLCVPLKYGGMVYAFMGIFVPYPFRTIIPTTHHTTGGESEKGPLHLPNLSVCYCYHFQLRYDYLGQNRIQGKKQRRVRPIRDER